ncbi:hypothetical protein [Corallococcus sp. EGB]|uniref:hypothetical protein n=1 Tax=Corallococcus sp. EGB TaxID=1521117 RepID=UPI001CBC58D7|nr:hypothetical protein [Corallococcus sp. EGB]
MTSGRFAPLSAVATVVLSGTFLMLAPAACHGGGPLDCGDTCAPVEGTYPLFFQDDAGVPPECANLDVQLIADGERLSIQRADGGGVLTGTLTGVELTGRVHASGAVVLNGGPLPSSDGGVNTFFSVNAIFTAGPDDGGSLSGTFSGDFSRNQGSSTLGCIVTRQFTATRQ